MRIKEASQIYKYYKSVGPICLGLDSIRRLIDISKRIDSEALKEAFDFCCGIEEISHIDVNWRILDVFILLANHPDTPKHIIVELINHKSTLVSFSAKQNASIANYAIFE